MAILRIVRILRRHAGHEVKRKQKRT